MSLLYSCPKYESCSAPVCPMWEGWRKTSQLRGERVCLYLREWSKVDGEQLVRERLLPEQAEAVAEVYREITAAGAHPCQGAGELRRVLKESALTPSKLKAGDRLHPSIPCEPRP